MKKVIKNTILLASIIVCLKGQATSNYILKKEPKATIVELENLKKGQKLFIKDNKGLIIYKEIIKRKGNYKKTFDLTALPDGNYFLEIEKDVEIKTIPFKVLKQDVVFNKKNEVIVFKPVVYLRGNNVYISRISKNGSTLKYKIYFEDEFDFFLSKTIKNEKVFGKIYNFSKAEKGTYRIVFNSDGKTYINNFKIK